MTHTRESRTYRNELRRDINARLSRRRAVFYSLSCGVNTADDDDVVQRARARVGYRRAGVRDVCTSSARGTKRFVITRDRQYVIMYCFSNAPTSIFHFKRITSNERLYNAECLAHIINLKGLPRAVHTRCTYLSAYNTFNTRVTWT